MSNLPFKFKIGSNKRIPYVKFYYLLFSLNIILVGVSIVARTILPPEIPLFYGLSSGEAQVTHTSNLIISGLISLSIVIVNILIATYTKDVFLKKIILISSLFTTIIIIFAVLKIIYLVGSIF